MSRHKQEFKPKKNYAYRLSPEKLDEIKRVFDVYDTDYDGLMEIKYIGPLMRVVGLYPTEKDIVEMTKELDANKEGLLSLGTVFIHIARCFRDIGEIETSTKNSLKKLSHEVETRGQKVRLLTSHSLSSTISDQVGEALTEEDTDDFIKSLPRKVHSGDGDIKLEEFIEFLMNDGYTNTKSNRTTSVMESDRLFSFRPNDR